MYLKPAEKGMPRYIAQVKELKECKGADGAGEKIASLGWYFRPEELHVDAQLPIFKNEIFASDEVAVLPVDTICGTCQVKTPAGLSAVAKTLPDVFVCSRKYVPQEG